MDDKFKRIEDKLDTVVEKIHSIDKTLERNTTSLEYHILRTNLLEADLKPIKSHVTLMNNIFKIIIFFSIITAIYKNLKP